MPNKHKVSAELLERMRLALLDEGNTLPAGLTHEDPAWDNVVEGDYDWILLHAAVILENSSGLLEAAKLGLKHAQMAGDGGVRFAEDDKETKIIETAIAKMEGKPLPKQPKRRGQHKTFKRAVKRIK